MENTSADMQGRGGPDGTTRRNDTKKITDKASRYVSFCKRRTGLFKKASYLCALCDAEAGIVVVSPTKRPYLFGYPSTAVIERYLSESSPSLEDSNSTVDCLLDGEEEETEMKTEAIGDGFWWEESIDDLSLEELKRYAAALEELKKKVAARDEEICDEETKMGIDDKSRDEETGEKEMKRRSNKTRDFLSGLWS